MDRVRAGFIPLTDAAILIAAHEKGFAEEAGITLELAREISWANIRDRMAVGHFEIAHMLAPMPVAAAIGLSPVPVEILAPMALGLGGNAVTASTKLYELLCENGYDDSLNPETAGKALAVLIEKRRARNLPDLVFGVVHPYSSHNYDLRYWLAACGIDPEKDLQIVVLPPSFMSDALVQGNIDGYCVGEPWNTASVAAGTGVILTTKSRLWQSSPEKVLGVSKRFAITNPELLDRIICSLVSAAIWCADPENHAELASILAGPQYLDQPVEVILPALSGNIAVTNRQLIKDPDFFTTFARAANFPWRSHALWYYSQMVRWGQASFSKENVGRAAASFAPDIFRRAAARMEIPVPAANSKVEGALTIASAVGAGKNTLYLGPDGFFDGALFDPDKVEDYIRSQSGIE
ncbi:MAG: ABC transporter substrate-binding protein [Sneathiella sp.]|nr:ABC transporter substrate-binding protein [Sneathiella sp.]